MFLSLLPWEMARILIFASPRAEKNLPATPVVRCIPSPIAAMMEQGATTSMVEI
jgi:hypothetical protein